MQNWFVTAIQPRYSGDGSDFYRDLLGYAQEWGFCVRNTLKDGRGSLFLRELELLRRIPRGARIVTTWPGVPRQSLAVPSFVNKLRYARFAEEKMRRRWTFFVMPIDRPLEQFRHRISARRYRIENQLEHRLFQCADGFLCCGAGMAEYFSSQYRSARIIRFDMYDQRLPASGPSIHWRGTENRRIALCGNLTRMRDLQRTLPTLRSVRYVFCGPGANWIDGCGRRDFTNVGVLSRRHLIPTLRSCDFGLIAYSRHLTDYCAAVMAGKLTTYLLAGLPVLCPSCYHSMAEYVRRSGTGMVLESLADLKHVEDISDVRYQQFRRKAQMCAGFISDGGHYREALVQAGLLAV
ncbi:MAG: hypothetical protein JSU70_19685 [Phycisphaerales bacterium]|nr:MAG: hypothetical protein JSU70_19685 [Phycisphaerales bacterium]